MFHGKVPDYASFANQIGSTEVKQIFRRLSKHNTTTMVTALTDLNDILPSLDYGTTFTEIVGYICLMFDHMFGENEVSLRLYSLKIMNQVIQLLKKDIVGYANLIFPILLLYTHDDQKEISDLAKEIFNNTFQAQEKKIKLLQQLNGDICEKITSFAYSLPSPKLGALSEENTNIFGRVASACVSLTTYMLVTLKKCKDIEYVFDSLQINDWLAASSNKKFYSSATPSLRSASYTFYYVTIQFNKQIYGNPQTVLQYLTRENDINSQIKLIKLIQEMINKSLIDIESIKPVLLTSLYLFSEPGQVGFIEFIRQMLDESYLYSCLDRVVEINNTNTAQQLFEVLINQSDIPLSDDYKIKLFEKMICADETQEFLHQYPLDMFKPLANRPEIDEILKTGNEERCLQYLEYLGAEHASQWLKSRTSMTASMLNNMIKLFGPEIVQTNWKSMDDIPLCKSDDQSEQNILAANVLNKREAIDFISKKPELVPDLLRNWTRDFSVFQSREMKLLTPQLLEKDLNLVPIIYQIFPNDRDISQIISSIIQDYLTDQKEIPPIVFDYYDPDESFLQSYLFSPSAALIPPGHSLVPKIFSFIPKLVLFMEPSALAKAVHQFLLQVNYDPTTLELDMDSCSDFVYFLWQMYGFETIPDKMIVMFLESFIQKRIPWIFVFLYIRDVDWHSIPTDIWDYVVSKPELAKLAHDEKNLAALAFICAANELELTDLPDDSFSCLAIPYDTPSSNESDELKKIILMEWHMLKPQFPELNPNIQLVLRQLCSYIAFNLPVIEDFDEVCDIIDTGLRSDNKLTYFLCLRCLSMIADTNAEIPVEMFTLRLISSIYRFSPLHPTIEAELVSALRIAYNLDFERFTFIVTRIIDFSSTPLIRFLMPLFQFFNGWDLLDDDLRHNMDLSNANNWNFITTCLLTMPSTKRLALSSRYIEYIPKLLDQLDFKSKEFELLITAFPITAMKWSKELDNETYKKLVKSLKQTTNHIFKGIVKSILKLKLEGTQIKYNYNNLTLGIIYKEDETSIPIRLDISCPSDYPITQPQIKCDLGDRSLSDVCLERINQSMAIGQTIEVGIKTWHAFVIARVKDADPCTICYSYLDERKCIPTVQCGTCGNAFHGKCLQKWFEKCHYPTCPYCGTPWHKKK